MDKLAKKRMIAIAKDTVKNPAKALLGGPSLSEAKKIIKKFGVKKKMNGGIMKASSGKMTEADLQKKVDRDARIREEKSDREVARELRILKARYAIDKAKERNKRFKGMSKGGMCRGMGAAIRGGDFKGVK